MGSSNLVTAPTLEPLTLAEAKAHLRVEVPDDDALIATLILVAREWVEGQTHRALMTQTWDFLFDYDWPMRAGRVCLRLPLAPVQSIVSVTYVDEGGVTRTLSASPTLYRLTHGAEQPRVVPAYDAVWPCVRDDGEVITVRAVCGYGAGQGDVPQPLRLAMRILIGHWYENREALIIGTIVAEAPLAVESLIAPYRRGFG